MLRVAAYTPGLSVPSARFRVRQYIPALRQLGVDVAESPARFGVYPPASRALRPAWALATIAERFGAVVTSARADVTLLQREMLSTYATFERFTRGPRVLDVDDAIWLRRRGRAAAALARMSDTVICGNSFIAGYFEGHARSITVIPTAVDTNRFRPRPAAPAGESRVICWSGTRSGVAFLKTIEKELAAVLTRGKHRRLRVVCDARPRLHSIPEDKLEYVRWSEQGEVAAIQSADAGIMPLPDSDWARGKCSYKLLTYMACGVPSVASPIGMNGEVLGRGGVGFSATKPTDWIDALELILSAPERAAATATAARALMEREFSIEVTAPKLAAALRRTAGVSE